MNTLLLLAADDRASLLGRLDALLAQSDDAIAATPAETRGRERLAILAPSAELRARLATARERLEKLRKPRLVMKHLGIDFAAGADAGRIAFVFPGQGSQHAGMLRELLERIPSARAWIEALDRAAIAMNEPPPSTLTDSHSLFGLETGAQLGTAADLAVFDVLTQLGFVPDAIVGHSNGEHAAILASGRAGILDRDELCRGFVELGRAGRTLPRRAPQRMIAVSALDAAKRETLLAKYAGQVFLAMENCPNQQLLGGSADAIQRIAAEIVAAGAVAASLNFVHAFHTPLFADWKATLANYYEALPLRDAGVPVYSCLTAAPIDGDPDACRRTMADQWTSMVRFRETVERMWADGVRTFVECGPDDKLSAFVTDTLRGKPHLAVSALSSRDGDLAHLQQLLGTLHTHGITVDPRRLESLTQPQPVASPWHAIIAAQQKLIDDARAMLARAPQQRIAFTRRLTRETDPWVDDHALGRPGHGSFPLPVLAFTTSLDIAADAARALTGNVVNTLTNLRAQRWLALDGGALDLAIEASLTAGGVQVRLGDGAFQATAGFASAAPYAPPEIRGAEPQRWNARDFYRRYAFHGPTFQGLARVTAISENGIEANLVTTATPSALLDCAGQLVAFWLLEHERREPEFGIFPFAAQRVVFHRPLPPAGTRVRCRGGIARPSAAMTEASFLFESERGEPLVSFEGLAQRLVEFPRPIARRIFAGEEADLTAITDWSILEESWGIWERALAHLALPPAELASWLAVTPRDERRRRLIDRITAPSPSPSPITISGEL